MGYEGGVDDNTPNIGVSSSAGNLGDAAARPPAASPTMVFCLFELVPQEVDASCPLRAPPRDLHFRSLDRHSPP
jgi:hypothetical protein